MQGLCSRASGSATRAAAVAVWPQRRRRRPRCPALASSYTQEAVAVIRAAQLEACRAGSYFVAPTQLLLGIVDRPQSEAFALLAAAGLTAEAAREALVDPGALPLGSSVGAADVDFSPGARAALSAAAAAATEAGLTAAGTPHLLLGVVRCGSAAVDGLLLERTGLQPAAFAEQVAAAAASCREAPAAPPSGQEQAAELVAQYRRHVAQHGSSAPPPGGLRLDGGASTAPYAKTPEDDDIYE